MELIITASRLYKFARLMSDISFQNRKTKLQKLLKEKEKEGYLWARDELKACLLAFDYLSCSPSERHEFQQKTKVPVDELEKILNRALFLMFNFEDLASVLIDDKKKAQLTTSLVHALASKLNSGVMTVEEFTRSYTFLEVVYYDYKDVEELLPTYVRKPLS